MINKALEAAESLQLMNVHIFICVFVKVNV